MSVVEMSPKRGHGREGERSLLSLQGAAESNHRQCLLKRLLDAGEEIVLIVTMDKLQVLL